MILSLLEKQPACVVQGLPRLIFIRSQFARPISFVDDCHCDLESNPKNIHVRAHHVLKCVWMVLFINTI